MSSSGPSPRKIKRFEEDPAVASGGNGGDEATRQALSDIEECQKELVELNGKASKEILQVETKYNKLRKPHYDKRAKVIDKIPNFWVDVIVKNPKLNDLMYKEEVDCLHFLKRLEVEEFENVENGFRVKFVFDENPFFDNPELVKEFQLGPNTEPKSTSTGIKWKEQMDLSEKQRQIIDARRKQGLEQKTFFSWFGDNKDPAADDIAAVIKDDLWPNPLQYYLTPDREDGDEEALEEGEEGVVVEVEEGDDQGNPGYADGDEVGELLARPVEVALPPVPPAAAALPQVRPALALPQAPPALALPQAPPALALPQAPPALVLPQAPPALALPQAPPALALPQAPPALVLPQAPPALALPQAPPATPPLTRDSRPRIPPKRYSPPELLSPRRRKSNTSDLARSKETSERAEATPAWAKEMLERAEATPAWATEMLERAEATPPWATEMLERAEATPAWAEAMLRGQREQTDLLEKLLLRLAPENPEEDDDA